MSVVDAVPRFTQVPTSSVATIQILAPNPARVGFIITNFCGGPCWVKFGLGAKMDDFSFKLVAGQTYEAPVAPNYVGVVTARWSEDGGFANVTEWL